MLVTVRAEHGLRQATVSLIMTLGRSKPMEVFIAPFIFLCGILAIFLLIRKLQQRTNPLVKFGMKYDGTLSGVRFRKARFAKFNLAPTIYCFYRHSMSYAVADGALLLRESFVGIPGRIFRIPLDVISQVGGGFRMKSGVFEFYATFGDDNENIRKEIKLA